MWNPASPARFLWSPHFAVENALYANHRHGRRVWIQLFSAVRRTALLASRGSKLRIPAPHLRSTRETFFDELPRAEYLYRASVREILNLVFAQLLNWTIGPVGISAGTMLAEFWPGSARRLPISSSSRPVEACRQLARLRNFSHLTKRVWSLGSCRLALLMSSSSHFDP
jgi:hypothetical protein